MRFMMLVRADDDTEAGVLPTKEMIDAMDKYNDELVKAGVLLAADGLHPSSKGASVSYSGGRPTVTDGPFAEAKELIAGYWLIQASSKEEAVQWATRVPFDEGTVEVRQVFDAADFPPEILSPEIAAKEQAWQEQQLRNAPKA
ncbi:YciI family protein [Kitasatospora sp. NPDC050543]|uniref:YciI family protein n=1 Tax=Kitasatospora sp. NPDC050543 TaxID=3364054 RepID=UPI0037AFD5E5